MEGENWRGWRSEATNREMFAKEDRQSQKTKKNHGGVGTRRRLEGRGKIVGISAKIRIRRGQICEKMSTKKQRVPAVLGANKKTSMGLCLKR